MAADDAILKAILTLEDQATKTLRGFGVEAAKMQREATASVGQVDSAFAVLSRRIVGYAASFLTVRAGIVAVRKATEEALEFDAELAKVASTSALAASNLEEFDELVLRLSSNLGRAREEISAGLLVASREARGDLEKTTTLLEESARLATATFTDTAPAVALVTDTLDAFGLEVTSSTVPAVTELLYKLQQTSGTALPEFHSLLGKLLIPARQAGFGLHETAAAIGVLTGVGQPAKRVMTELEAIMAALAEPTDEMREAARLLGIDLSADRLAAEGFAGVLDQLHEKIGGNTKQLRELFKSQAALVGITELSTERYDEFREALEELQQETHEVQRGLETRLERPSQRIGLLWNELSLGVTKLGGGILEALTPGVAVTEGLAEALRILRIEKGKFTDIEIAREKHLAELRLRGGFFRDPAGGGLSEEEIKRQEKLLADFLAKLKVETAEAARAFEELGVSAAAIPGTFVGSTPEGLAAQEKRIELIEAEIDIVKQSVLAIREQELAWQAAATKAHDAGEISGDAMEKELATARRVADELERLAVLQAQRVQLAQNLQRAILEDRGLESFRAQWKLLVQELRPGALGARAAQDAFGLLNSTINDVSRQLVTGELSFKSFARNVGQDIAALLVKFALLRAAASIFGGGYNWTGMNSPGTQVSYRTAETGGILSGSMLGRATVPRAFAEQLARHAIPVRGYDRGGIADTPQIAVFGRHGRSQAEAFVPLGGDRKIPVKIVDQPAAQGAPVSIRAEVNLSVTSLDPRGAADVVLAQMPEIKRQLGQALIEGRERILVDGVRQAARRRG